MMNHRFFTYFPLWLVLAAGLLFHACTDGPEEPGATMPGTEEQGVFRLAYRVGGTDIAVQTRADGETTTPGTSQEDGWDGDWHENDVNRLAISVIDGSADGGQQIRGRVLNVPKESGSLPTEFTEEELGLEQDETLAVGDRIYMIANYTEATATTDDAKTFHTSTTLDDLQTIVNGAELVPNKQQTDFLMDGFVTLTDEHLSGKEKATVPLRRAAAKIRIYFENNYLQTADHLKKYIVRAKLVYYAPTSLMLEEAESDFDTETYPDRVEPKRMGNIKDNDYLTYTETMENGTTRTYIVFYSYSNNWYDKSKFDYDETNRYWTVTDFTKEAPVLRTRQTYVTIYAPYVEGGGTPTENNENDHYYYRVPMNNSFYAKNDQVGFTDNEIAEIKNLYCLQRNHIYTIKANIDRKGSDNEDGALILPVTIENLKDGGEYHYEY